MDSAVGGWVLMGDAAEFRQSREQGEVCAVLREAKGPLGPKAIAEALGRPQAIVRQLLSRMAREGQIQPPSYGKYSLKPDHTDHTDHTSEEWPEKGSGSVISGGSVIDVIEAGSHLPDPTGGSTAGRNGHPEESVIGVISDDWCACSGRPGHTGGYLLGRPCRPVCDCGQPVVPERNFCPRCLVAGEAIKAPEAASMRQGEADWPEWLLRLSELLDSPRVLVLARDVDLTVQLFVAQDGGGDPADPFGVGDRVDLDDLAVDDGEPHDGEGLSTQGDDHAGCSVHQRGVQAGSRERAHDCLPGNGRRTMDHLRGGRVPGAKVGSQHDVGVEQGEEGVEVAPACRQEEGVDHLALTSEVGLRSR